MRIPSLLLLVATALGLSETAASARSYDNNFPAWYNYFGDHPIQGTDWGIHLDTQIRRDHLGKNHTLMISILSNWPFRSH